LDALIFGKYFHGHNKRYFDTASISSQKTHSHKNWTTTTRLLNEEKSKAI
jgi:hypothetical protein